MESFPIAAPAFAGDSRSVPAGNAFEWLRTGWAIFAAAPGIWVVIALIMLIGSFLLALVPLFGQVASLVLTPLLAAGALQAWRNTAQGRTPEVADLFWAFRHRTGPLATLGLIYMGSLFAIILVAIVLVGGGSYLGGQLFGGGTVAAIGGGAIAGFLAATIALLASLPLFMAIWFAPALVAFNEMPPVDAMRASFFACAKNVGAISVFSVVFLVAAFFATLAAGLGWLILLPLLFGALGTSYRDVFPSA